jgi:hypothetical protein
VETGEARSAFACLEDDMGCSATFTVYFEDPFWVGVVELDQDGAVYASRHVFGAEPTNPELLAFVLGGCYDRLARRALAGAPVEGSTRAVAGRADAPRLSARRAAREAARQASGRPTTAAQEAIRQALERAKQQRRTRTRQQREAEALEQRRKAVAKAKARHRGR